MKYKCKLLLINLKLKVTRKKVIAFIVVMLIVLTIPVVSAYYCKNYQLNLSKAEMLEDYDYLFDTLKNNYPFYPFIARYDDNVDSYITYVRSKMEMCKSDSEYFDNIHSVLSGFDQIGNLDILTYWNFKYNQDWYNHAKGEEFKPYTEILNSKDIENNYYVLKEIHGDEAYKSPFRNKSKVKTVLRTNVYTEILDEGKVAYIHINSFDEEYSKRDSEILFDFYDKVRNYENVIIDIRDNYSGTQSYFIENIVEPNISATLSAEYYLLFKTGENNIRFLKDRFEETEMKDITMLPHFENLNREDLKQLDKYVIQNFTIKPASDTKIINGKVWLLVNGKSYGASDKLASFCKQTGFATVVGTETAGNGLGIEPMLIVLPNSKLVVQYNADYNLNKDGSCNIEYGTKPDINVNGNEDILDRCLTEIDKTK